MTVRPIIFSGEMVRALLDGRKTQTRRLATSPLRKCEVGDRLYVRESMRWDCYMADGALRMAKPPPAYEMKPNTPSIHMPRWASRLTLTVIEVREQPIMDISLEDCVAEGWPDDGPDAPSFWFRKLWNSLHSPPNGWADNPKVVALTFTVEQHNVDREQQP